MSHDRGCPCGREKYEYDDCKDPTCWHKEAVNAAVAAETGGSRTWQAKLVAERRHLGRDLTLNELLALGRTHKMTDAEIEAQRQSWARQMMD